MFTDKKYKKTNKKVFTFFDVNDNMSTNSYNYNKVTLNKNPKFKEKTIFKKGGKNLYKKIKT